MRRQAIERFRLRPERVVAVPEAAAALVPAGGRACPPAAPYFLFVGTLEPRKNLPVLLEAWRRGAAHACRWIWCWPGGAAEDSPPIAEPSPACGCSAKLPMTICRGSIRARWRFVYPSLYEGFGLPVLEAMQCGALRDRFARPLDGEVAGDAAVYAGMRRGELAARDARRRAAELRTGAAGAARERSICAAPRSSPGNARPADPRSLQEARRRFGLTEARPPRSLLAPEAPYPLAGGGALRTASLLQLPGASATRWT